MATEGTLDERYLTWLYSQVGLERNLRATSSHWSLVSQLYQKQFHWSVRNDDNRDADGLDLRLEWVRDNGIEVDDLWMSLGCSVMEMLVALARRASFMSIGTPGDWFWEMMENVDLRQFVDAKYNDDTHMEVNETLDRIIYRQYDRTGLGGLFPLQHPRQDQKKVELAYQLSAYLLEGDYLAQISRA